MRLFLINAILLLLLNACSDPMESDSESFNIWTETQHYTDKLFDKTYTFTPRNNEIGIKFISTVSLPQIKALADEFMLIPIIDLRENWIYYAFTLPDSSMVEDIGPQVLLRETVAGALPIYTDQEGYSRYIDPEWFTVQFVDDLSEEEMESILLSWGVDIIEDYWTPGYYMITCPHGLNVFDSVRKHMNVSSVKFTEPAFYGFNDDLEMYGGITRR